MLLNHGSGETLESPLDSKEIKWVNPKGNQPWILIGRTDTGAEAPILWPPDVQNWLIAKDPDVGKNWRQEKGMREDEMVGRHCWHNGHELEQAPRVGDGQWSLACYSPWDRRTGHDWVTELRGKRTITYRGGYAMGWNLSRISKGQDGEMAFLHAER